jgi:thiol:disulfide interchange protein DsbD
MKKLSFAFAVVVLLLASAALAQDYNSALKTAKRENKPVLLYFYSNSCYYCTVMDKTTLADKDVAAIIKKDFVFLRVDADNPGELGRLYRIVGTPSSWFLESSGKRVGEIPGYIPTQEYKLILAYIKGKRYNDIDLEAYLKKASAKK